MLRVCWLFGIQMRYCFIGRIARMTIRFLQYFRYFTIRFSLCLKICIQKFSIRCSRWLRRRLQGVSGRVKVRGVTLGLGYVYLCVFVFVLRYVLNELQYCSFFLFFFIGSFQLTLVKENKKWNKVIILQLLLSYFFEY